MCVKCVSVCVYTLQMPPAKRRRRVGPPEDSEARQSDALQPPACRGGQDAAAATGKIAHMSIRTYIPYLYIYRTINVKLSLFSYSFVRAFAQSLDRTNYILRYNSSVNSSYMYVLDHTTYFITHRLTQATCI